MRGAAEMGERHVRLADDVILKLLRKSPEDRYASAQDVIEALRQVRDRLRAIFESAEESAPSITPASFGSISPMAWSRLRWSAPTRRIFDTDGTPLSRTRERSLAGVEPPKPAKAFGCSLFATAGMTLAPGRRD